jgi:hypothetical protein
MVSTPFTGTAPKAARPLSDRFSAVRAEFRARRAARLARQQLFRELSTYTRPSEIDDLSAILDRYDDAEVADIRRILHRSHAA